MIELMKPSYLVFPEIEFNNSKVKNFSRLWELKSIPEEYLTDKHIIFTEIPDDSKIEGISYKLYSSTNYWDIIMFLNEMDSPFQLPVNSNIVISRAENKFQKWLEKTKYIANYSITEETYNFYKEKFLEEEENLNEKYRTIKYISSDSLFSLLKDLGI